MKKLSSESLTDLPRVIQQIDSSTWIQIWRSYSFLPFKTAYESNGMGVSNTGKIMGAL